MGIKVNEEFYQNGFNLYRKLKPLQRIGNRDQSYIDIFENAFTQIWDISGLPEDFDKRVYFKLKLYDGRVGWYQDSKGIYVGKVAEVGGDLDRYGHLTDAEISFLNGEMFKGERDKDIIIGYLNTMKTAEPNFKRFAYMLSQVDLSIECNIENTRLNPVPIFQDQKIKDTIEQTIDAIRNGDHKFYVYDSTLKSALSNELGNGQRFDLLNLTDVSNVDKIQYLNETHQELLERLAILYGINMSRSNKLAQVNEDEIKGYSELAKINILNMLGCFKEEFDKVNSIFGTNLSVTLSKPWAWILEEDTEETEEPDEEGKEGKDDEPSAEDEKLD